MKRTIVVGDIHGCISEFEHLMDEVSYKKKEDVLLLLGDLIDRGPDPAAVVAFAEELGAICVMGNHEEKALRWRRHEQRRKDDPTHYKNPMLPVHEDRLAQWAKIPDKHWEWIDSWPITRDLGNGWLAVHAGMMPGVALNHQRSNEMMRIRYVDVDRKKMANLDAAGNALPGTVHWTDLWDGPQKIVYGHYTYMNGLRSTPWTLGLDTGCVHGGELTAAVFRPELQGFEIFSMRARKVYSPRKAWNEE